MFDIFPNMYIVLVGPSGCRKGTAMGVGQKFLTDLGIKMAAEATTREALIKALGESNDTTVGTDNEVYLHASLTIYSPELTVFLGYNNVQLMSDLCDWFDCREQWTYRTKNQGTDTIYGVWVNLCGATTPDLLKSTLPSDAIGGGLTARMIMVYAPKKEKTVLLPIETDEEKELRSMLLSDLEKISMLSGPFRVDDSFIDNYTRWYAQADDNPPFDDPRMGGYIERRPLHTLKLSMIVSASRSSSRIVTGDDFIRAKKILETTESYMLRAYSGVGKSKLSDVLSDVMYYIAAEKLTTEKRLLQRFWQDADKFELDRILQTLDSMGFIAIKVTGTEKVIKYKGGIKNESVEDVEGTEGKGK
jgi:hypothetical protein